MKRSVQSETPWTQQRSLPNTFPSHGGEQHGHHGDHHGDHHRDHRQQVNLAAVSQSQSLVKPKDFPASKLLELLKPTERVASTRLRWLIRSTRTKLFSSTTSTTRNITQRWRDQYESQQKEEWDENHRHHRKNAPSLVAVIKEESDRPSVPELSTSQTL